MTKEKLVNVIDDAYALLRKLYLHYMRKANEASKDHCRYDKCMERANNVIAVMGELADASDWLEEVRKYKATFLSTDKHGNTPIEIDLQALSAQNMADTIRNLYGENVQITEICEIREDWK